MRIVGKRKKVLLYFYVNEVTTALIRRGRKMEGKNPFA
jgi:hypothetical protein